MTIAVLLALPLALQAAAPPPSDVPHFRGEGQMRMFDMICGNVFPDDARIAAGMTKIPGARPLTGQEVRTYLKDDPGQGWTMPAGTSQIVVTVESPPIHACAVRITNTDGIIDERRWQQLLTVAQARSGGGFTTMPPQTFEVGGLRTQASGVQKQGPDGSAEAYYLLRTSAKDPATARGYGIEVRMVRQLVSAPRR